MSNYTKIQFISWELHTGPLKVYPGTQAGYYSGLQDTTPDHRTDVLGQCWDIDARLLFTADAVNKAYALADKHPDTLKVFMGPEFLFRGAGGAYLHDLINGWTSQAPAEFNLPAPYNAKWAGLFGGLQAIAANANYETWLFVFGTAVSASFPTRQAINGACVLDPQKFGEIYSTALIQHGGAGHGADNYASRKHYISPIDFLKWYADAVIHTEYTVLPADPRAIIPADLLGVSEGGAMFTIANINDSNGNPIPFGLEVCLDHALSGGTPPSEFGRLRTANQSVKVQLVPSGGMSLMDASIRLLPATGPTPHAYAFNCDGLANLSPPAYGSHTQVWNGANGAPVPATSKLVGASSGEPLAGTLTDLVANKVTTVRGPVLDSALWNNGGGVQGAGHVRIINPLPL